MLHLFVLFLIPGFFNSTEGILRRVCEHSGGHLTINCGSQEIDIVRAFYGRTSRIFCQGYGPIKTNNCQSVTSMMVVINQCQGQQTCTLNPTNAAFGDPCVGTAKYLEISYKCVPRTGLYGRLLQICEGSSVAIHCRGHKTINIMSANYGLLIDSRGCGGPVKATNCATLGRALSRVRRNCQGSSSCVLQASNSIFGDPCVGTKKYLEVRYRCQ
ncbi:L-rhamnose-binding lectin CSL3-like [Montipora foliosa]|uniref:L-rhamnose-binding lectin CSL3-like n=1 Tax=Montipora foliosa TaxID=591990 RepID=UPI0035F1924B